MKVMGEIKQKSIETHQTQNTQNTNHTQKHFFDFLLDFFHQSSHHQSSHHTINLRMWRSGIDWLAALDRPICIWRGNAPWSTHSNPTSQMPSMSAPSMSHTKKHIKTQWQRQYKGPWAGGLLPCLGVGRAGGFDCFVLVWRGPVQVWFDCLVWWWEALCAALSGVEGLLLVWLTRALCGCLRRVRRGNNYGKVGWSKGK